MDGTTRKQVYRLPWDFLRPKRRKSKILGILPFSIAVVTKPTVACYVLQYRNWRDVVIVLVWKADRALAYRALF